jgi:hypothetical protein
MCYLCLKDNPFGITNNLTNLHIKKMRLLQIKRHLKDTEDSVICGTGQEEIQKLKEEQYKLSRDL